MLIAAKLRTIKATVSHVLSQKLRLNEMMRSSSLTKKALNNSRLLHSLRHFLLLMIISNMFLWSKQYHYNVEVRILLSIVTMDLNWPVKFFVIRAQCVCFDAFKRICWTHWRGWFGCNFNEHFLHFTENGRSIVLYWVDTIDCYDH